MSPLVLRDEDDVSISSKDLLDEHRATYAPTVCSEGEATLLSSLLTHNWQERILRQKHSLTVIPIFCAHYVYKDRVSAHMVFGFALLTIFV